MTTTGNYQNYDIQTYDYVIRREVHQNRKHIVVPVVMMVEGVHNGSAGPIFHPISELGKFPEAWNGIPVTVNHPTDGQGPVSANSPPVIDAQTIGRVYNTRVEGTKLKAEAWIDEEKVKQVCPEILEYIEKKKPLDVSVGVFTEEEQVEGEWNGEVYRAIARNHRPDHLAFLPGGVGACSWADGCGVRAYEKEGGQLNRKELVTILAEHGATMLVHEISLQDIIRKISDLIWSQFGDEAFLEEVFDTYFIFEQNNQLYKQEYKVTSNEETGKEEIELVGEAVPVKRKVEYVVQEEKKEPEFIRTRGGAKMTECSKAPIIQKLVQYAVFNEEDKEWLAGLEQDKIEKIVKVVEDYEAKLKEYEKQLEEAKAEPEKEAKPQVNMEQAIQVLKENIKQPEDILELAPDTMKEALKEGLKLHAEKRETFISTITSYSEAFTKEELESKSMAELEKLVSLIPKKAVYAVKGVGNNNDVTVNEEVLLPPGVEVQMKGGDK